MNNLFKVTTEWANDALVNNKKYSDLYMFDPVFPSCDTGGYEIDTTVANSIFV